MLAAAISHHCAAPAYTHGRCFNETQQYQHGGSTHQLHAADFENSPLTVVGHLGLAEVDGRSPGCILSEATREHATIAAVHLAWNVL